MPDRPNVVFVLADQMRAHAMGCAGNPDVETPTLDRMAERGIHFENAYTPQPGCCPTRGSLLTGQYSHGHGVVNFNVRLPTTADTVSQRLADAGYATGYVGKWHLDGTAAPGHVPPERRHGFEFWRGFNRGHRYHRGHPHPRPDGSVEWEEGYQPAVQTDHAIEFVDEHAGEDPFFCYLSWGPPHTPFDAPEEYSEMYDPGDLALRANVPEGERIPELRADLAEYYALVTSLDDQLERLLAAIEEQGVADDTLVVFTADHGEQLGSQGRYRKGFPFEESVRVPLLVSPPGDASATIEAPVSTLDLPGTFLSYAGANPLPRDEGADLRPVVAGDNADPHPEGVYMQNNIAFDSAWRALRTDRHLLVVDRDVNVRYLYDLESDPLQQDNLAGDPAHADLQERLYEAFVAAAERHGDSLIWSRWYASRELGNPLDAPDDTFGAYDELPGDRPRFDPGS
ncbi:MAG: sulfatase [Halobacteriaceae archaeon]